MALKKQYLSYCTNKKEKNLILDADIPSLAYEEENCYAQI